MRKTVIKMVVGFVAIIAVVLFIYSKPDFISNIIQPGAGVRNAYLTQYSETITIEEAFDDFFDNSKWSTYKEGGYSYVAFTGVCEYLEKRSDIKIIFKLTGENFVVDSLDINGITQNDFILYGLLSKIYEDC